MSVAAQHDARGNIASITDETIATPISRLFRELGNPQTALACPLHSSKAQSLTHHVPNFLVDSYPPVLAGKWTGSRENSPLPRSVIAAFDGYQYDNSLAKDSITCHLFSRSPLIALVAARQIDQGIQYPELEPTAIRVYPSTWQVAKLNNFIPAVENYVINNCLCGGYTATTVAI
jgi:hypothetical protein